jgi:hypothetical protein
MQTKTCSNHPGLFNPFLLLYSLMLILSFLPHPSIAQSYDSLTPLQGHQPQVYYSQGAAAKAKRMAGQIDQVMQFYSAQTGFTPSVVLLVLSPADWIKYSPSMVYGMPHYTDSKTLIVAAENNEFWKSFIPPLDKLPGEYANAISETYKDSNGGLTMEPFFDLLAIHELGHAYHQQGGLQMQRKWMGELFVNLFLHSYIAQKEPRLLPALTLFPKMVVAVTNTASLKYTSLQDLERYYTEIARQYPQNYGWYQCRWHREAAGIYEAGGLTVFKKLWAALLIQREILDDPGFAGLLNEKVHPRVALVLQKWDAGE